MISTIGTNTNQFSFPTYSNSNSQSTMTTSPANNEVNLLTEQYQPSSMDSLSSSWDLLTQSYSPQSILNNFQQQQNNSSTTDESFQQQVMNEIQSNPGDAVQMAQDSNLNSLVQSQFGLANQGQSDNLSLLAGSYDAMNISSNLNLYPTNDQLALTQVQSNPLDAVVLQQEQATSQLLQSQFSALGNNLDISI